MKTNGGKRENAGRKPKYGDSETKTIRVPISRIADIEMLLSSNTNPKQIDVETEVLRETIDNIVWKWKEQQNPTSPRWSVAIKILNELAEALKHK